jgi:hypothetical protein
MAVSGSSVEIIRIDRPSSVESIKDYRNRHHRFRMKVSDFGVDAEYMRQVGFELDEAEPSDG